MRSQLQKLLAKRLPRPDNSTAWSVLSQYKTAHDHHGHPHNADRLRADTAGSLFFPRRQCTKTAEVHLGLSESCISNAILVEEHGDDRRSAA